MPFQVHLDVGVRGVWPVMGMPVEVLATRRYDIDGEALTATCPVGRTYCTDACVNTATDPLNCGGCGLMPAEVCDTINNDCDGTTDEGCPIRLNLGSGATLVPPSIGGTDPGDSGAGSICSASEVVTGICVNVDDATGNIRSFRTSCGRPVLVLPTAATPDEYEIQTFVRACGTSGGGGSSGGTGYLLPCPANTIMDGLEGLQDPYLGQVRARCSTYDVQRRADGTWAIVRTGSTFTAAQGTGPGTPFSWILRDGMTSGNPGGIRQAELRYDVPGVITRIDLYGTWPWLTY